MGTALWLQGLIFVGVFCVVFWVAVKLVGQRDRQRRQLESRLQRIRHQHQRDSAISLRREQYLKGLSPLEQKLESLPGMAFLRKLIEQSGRSFPAYRFALGSALVALLLCLVLWRVSGQLLLALPALPVLMALPLYQLVRDRQQQLDRFEEQLPDALDSITRALRAGHPFNDAMQMISKEMPDPIAREFALTSAEINYGSDFKSAMLNLLERMPSMSLMAAVASVLIQRETGGNLSEVISNISGLIRSRFQLQRKVRTLSAEGRLSAWVLLLLPFALMLVIQVINPHYLLPLFQEPLGKKLLYGSAAGMVLGLIWIQRIIKIDF